jgi:hypothetical protein
MKKKIYLVSLSLLIPVTIFSQKDTSLSKWSICAGAGIGYPTGDFSNTSFAYKGPTELLFATDNIKNSIYDVVIMGAYNSNNFNLEENLNNPANGMGAPVGQAISNGTYKEISALTGFSVSIPKNTNSISLNIQFLLGAIYSISPYMEYYSYDQKAQVEDHITVYPTGFLSICLDMGVNFKIPIYKKVFVIADFNYFLGGAAWNLTEHITNNSGSSKQSYDDNVAFDIQNLTFGVGYRL